MMTMKREKGSILYKINTMRLVYIKFQAVDGADAGCSYGKLSDPIYAVVDMETEVLCGKKRQNYAERKRFFRTAPGFAR